MRFSVVDSRIDEKVLCNPLGDSDAFRQLEKFRLTDFLAPQSFKAEGQKAPLKFATLLADLQGKRIAVRNPSNLREDFGERWDENPEAYTAFKTGIRTLQKEWAVIATGGRETNKELERLFGEYVRTALVKQSQRLQEARKAGALAVGSTGAITGLASGVARIRPNVFHGDE